MGKPYRQNWLLGGFLRVVLSIKLCQQKLPTKVEREPWTTNISSILPFKLLAKAPLRVVFLSEERSLLMAKSLESLMLLSEEAADFSYCLNSLFEKIRIKRIEV